jgi:hypothetical protein
MSTIFYGVPGKLVYEPPKLIIKQIAGKTMYWNYTSQRWVRLTRRCPYLT